MKDWTTLEDGGSGRWIYAREVAELVWVFLRIDSMVDACGGDATYYFHCDVGVVDLKQGAECGTLTSALEYCDAYSWIDDVPERAKPLAMAQCLFDHGSWSPLWQDGSPEIDKDDDGDWKFDIPDEDDPQFTDLLKAGREWAEENLLEEARREHLLDTKIVNKLGQTAREFAGGIESTWDILRKIRDAPLLATKEQRLVLKMYQNAGQTLGYGPVPADITGEREEK